MVSLVTTHLKSSIARRYMVEPDWEQMVSWSTIGIQKLAVSHNLMLYCMELQASVQTKALDLKVQENALSKAENHGCSHKLCTTTVVFYFFELINVHLCKVPSDLRCDVHEVNTKWQE